MKNTVNFKIIVSYNGARYAGWQRQENGLAVQELLETAVGKVCGHPVIVRGSGRTDAGVHALGQVASFETGSKRTPGQIVRGSNSLLPDDVAVLSAEEVPPGFDARFSATGKTYGYDFLVSPVRLPLKMATSWHVGPRLDWDAVREALPCLEGEKDFAAFRSAGSPVKSTVRRMFRAVLSAPEPDVARLELTASGFLRNMARAIAGSVYEIGRGKMSPRRFPDIISLGNRALTGLAAPPQGLCLREVYYEPVEIPGD
ncbi:MAG: tRNA pseudouridine(38-40) synthase TruA [Deltaproteobacteria bacterium]|jgi:tRNA pseudouridine38-40 synthase|nr:tRNA pseudouridine(38-40) synthase TruA [Deltaproteobacteria bacterium]